MDRSAIRQPNALPALMAISTAARLSAGNAPGSPRQTGQTCVFGAAPNSVEQAQKIFDRVRSCACTSSPITGSNASGIGHQRRQGLRLFHGMRELEERLLVEG